MGKRIYGGVDAAGRRGPMPTREDPTSVRAFVREIGMDAYEAEVYMHHRLEHDAPSISVVVRDRMGKIIHEWNGPA